MSLSMQKSVVFAGHASASAISARDLAAVRFRLRRYLNTHGFSVAEHSGKSSQAISLVETRNANGQQELVLRINKENLPPAERRALHQKAQAVLEALPKVQTLCDNRYRLIGVPFRLLPLEPGAEPVPPTDPFERVGYDLRQHLCQSGYKTDKVGVSADDSDNAGTDFSMEVTQDGHRRYYSLFFHPRQERLARAKPLAAWSDALDTLARMPGMRHPDHRWFNLRGVPIRVNPGLVREPAFQGLPGQPPGMPDAAGTPTEAENRRLNRLA